MAEAPFIIVSREGIEDLWDYSFLISGNSEEDCQHALRTENPDVETIEKTLAALAEQITKWEAEPEASRPTLWIHGNIYKMRFLDAYREDLVERALRAASGPSPLFDWVNYAFPSMQRRRVLETHERAERAERAELVEMPDKERRFETLLRLLAEGYVPLTPPGEHGAFLYTELALQQFLDDVASDDRPGVRAWYANQAEERKRFVTFGLAKANSELCEYAAAYYDQDLPNLERT